MWMCGMKGLGFIAVIGSLLLAAPVLGRTGLPTGEGEPAVQSSPTLCAEKVDFILPPLAEVQTRDNVGQTWRVTGKISGALPVAQEDFRLALAAELADGQGHRIGSGCKIVLVEKRKTKHDAHAKGNRAGEMRVCGGVG